MNPQALFHRSRCLAPTAWCASWLLLACSGNAQVSPTPGQTGPALGEIDYARPETYLASGTQSTLPPEAWTAIDPHLPSKPWTLENLAQIYAWKRSWFQSVSGGGKFVGRHTVEDLVRQRFLTGCHDHGLLLVTVLRHGGIPAVLVDATGIEWALEYPDRTRSFRGHVFVEAYLDGAWRLLDSVSGEFLADYNPQNPVIPIPKPNDPRGFYVMFKGLDPAGYGITSIEQLNQAQARFAQRIRDGISDLRAPDSVVRRLR